MRHEATPRARLAEIRRALLRWYEAARRDLPWRLPAGRSDPYRTWVSEVMLQQTRVATVVPYYRRFLKRFPSLRALAVASEGEVLAAWSGLGYYSRARALLRAAREAVARFGGLPRTVEELRELPGLGPYTAGAVASIAFGLPVPAVDGNAGRVLARLFLVAYAPHTRRYAEVTWTRAGELVRSASRPGDLNQALIELGALLCRPAAPACGRCPLARQCAAHLAGAERSIPAPRRRPGRRHVRIAVGVCTWRGRVLLVRRPSRGLFAGMWAPPSVTIAVGESPASAISSAINREPFVATGEFALVGSVERELTHRTLELQVFAAPMTRLPRRSGELQVVAPNELDGLAIPAAMRAALNLARR